MYVPLVRGPAPAGAQPAELYRLERPAEQLPVLLAEGRNRHVRCEAVELAGRAGVEVTAGVLLVGEAAWSDYVVEVEVMRRHRWGYLGLLLRAQDATSGELIRFDVNGRDERRALARHLPLRDGIAAWWLSAASGSSAVCDLPQDEWVPVRVEVWGGTARAFVGDTAHPLLQFRLGYSLNVGAVGLWCDGRHPVAFANLRYTTVRRPTVLLQRRGALRPREPPLAYDGWYLDLAAAVEAVGAAVVVTEESPSAEELSRHAAYVLLLPQYALPDSEIEAVWQYLDAGGSLVLTTDHAKYHDLVGSRVNRLLERYDLRFREEEWLGRSQWETPLLPNLITRRARAITCMNGHAIEGPGTALAWNRSGDVVALHRRLDSGGNILLFSDNTPFIDLFTPEADNLAFLEEVMAYLVGEAAAGSEPE